ncbi:anti-sigma factor antagonist [Streptomyces kronopolitis]
MVKVVVVGELDVYTAPAWRRFLLEQLDKEALRHMILDMTDVTYYDSTALGATVLTLEKLRRRQGVNCQLVVVANSHISRVLTVTGLTKVFPLVDSEEAALREIESLTLLDVPGESCRDGEGGKEGEEVPT